MARIMETPEFRFAVSEGEDIIIGLYVMTVGLVAVGANIAVLWRTVKRKKVLTDMDIITINICICQIVPAILCYPRVVVLAFSHGPYFSNTDCKRDGFCIYFFAMSTIGLLLLMTYYRHDRMFRSHFFRRQDTSRLTVYVGLGASYLYGLLWALPPALGYGSYILQSHNMACSLEWTTLPLPYIVALLLLGYLLPVSTMVGVYGRILVTVRSYSQQTATRSDKTFRKTDSVTIMSILHCAFFLLVWTPYAILSFIIIFTLPVSDSLYIISSLFAKVDVLVNPFVFFVISKTMSRSTSTTQGQTQGPELKKEAGEEKKQISDQQDGGTPPVWPHRQCIE